MLALVWFLIKARPTKDRHNHLRAERYKMLKGQSMIVSMVINKIIGHISEETHGFKHCVKSTNIVIPNSKSIKHGIYSGISTIHKRA